MDGELRESGPGLASRLRQVPFNLQQYGVVGTLEYYGDRLYEAWCDRRFGVDTRTRARAHGLGFVGDRADCVEYAPTSYRNLNRVFAYLQPRSHDVFLDYGCGMGRVLVQAGRWPFRMVIGVELSPELAYLAKRNVERASEHLQCRVVYVHAGDAAEYEVPQSISLVYLCNPFRGRILAAVMQRIFEAASGSGLIVRIVYLYPSKGATPLDAIPWLRCVADLSASDARNDMSLLVYETRISGRRYRGEVSG